MFTTVIIFVNTLVHNQEVDSDLRVRRIVILCTVSLNLIVVVSPSSSSGTLASVCVCFFVLSRGSHNAVAHFGSLDPGKI